MTPFTLPPRLTAERDRLSETYSLEDFKCNPDGYTVAPYVNAHSIPAAFDEGFNAACALLFKEVIGPMREALEKVSDPRKRDHTEPDKYTEVGCMIHIATEVLDKTKNWYK